MPTLIHSLTPPGDSETYINPDHRRDHDLSSGDWVHGKPGVSNSKRVRQALDRLKNIDIEVPVWDRVRGHCGQTDYRVSSFARIRLISYHLPCQNRLTLRYLGDTSHQDSTNQAPLVDAGADQTVEWPNAVSLGGTVADDGLPSTQSLTVAWSKSSGPGTVVFAQSNRVDTTASFSTSGVYVLCLTASDTLLTGSDVVSITVNVPNRAPEALPQTVILDEDSSLLITLQGSDADGDPLAFLLDAPPSYGMLTGTPPRVVYIPTNDYFGSDNFSFKVSDGRLESASASVGVEVRPVNDAPVADSQSATGREDSVLQVFMSGADLEGSPVTFQIVRAPAFGILNGLTSNRIDYLPPEDFHGEDVFGFVTFDGELYSPTATVALVMMPVNDAPEVEAGADLMMEAGGWVGLQGVVSDDDDPAGIPLRTVWSQESGPAPAFISNALSVLTAARFDQPGEYVLRLSASDSELMASDDIAVSVRPAGPNLTPVVNAGRDTMIGLSREIDLQGEITDDGLPYGVPVVSQWSLVSGPGEAYFADPSQSKTIATFSQSGAYVLRLSGSDSEKESCDDISIMVYASNLPPVVSAGPDQTSSQSMVALQGRIIDDGQPAGQALRGSWTQVSGPDLVVFDPSDGPVSSASFLKSGTYVLRLTGSDTEFAVSDDVVVNVNANCAPRVEAGEAQILDLVLAEEGQSTNYYLPRNPMPDHWIYDMAQPGLTGVPSGTVYARVMPNDLDSESPLVFVGGAFNFANSSEARGLAIWSGCDWSTLCDPRLRDDQDVHGFVRRDAIISSVAVRGGEVFVGGGFLKDLSVPPDGAGDITGRWNGQGWEEWNFRLVNAYGATLISQRSILAVSNAVYVGGHFQFQPLDFPPSQDTSVVPGVPVAENLAKWNGTNWEVMGAGITDIRNTASSHSYGDVFALAEGPDGSIYAGGTFTMQTSNGLARNLARWRNDQWEPVGEGIDGYRVHALEFDPQGHLYVGGDFTNAGGVVANNIAKAAWNEASQTWEWSSLGQGISNGVYRYINAMTWHQSNLYVGGTFNYAANARPASKVACWDGSRWSGIGSGTSNGVNGTVNSLCSAPDGLYIGGQYTLAGGRPAGNMVKWGVEVSPSLILPDPITVQNASTEGSEVVLTAWAGHPCGIPLTVTWNVDGGPAEYTTVLPLGSTAPETPITFTNAYPVGTHLVAITVEDGITPPMAGVTTVIILSPAVATLAGTVVDDGLPSDTLRFLWSLASGPGSPVWGCETCEVTTATFGFVGSYVLRLTADDTELSASDEVVVHVKPTETTNYPPAVNAGLDQRLLVGESATLSGTVSDDGHPTGGALDVQWSVVGGVGEVGFSSSNELSTTVSFNEPGRYIVRLTATDGEWSSYDELAVIVDQDLNQPPVVSAGSDQTIMFPNPAMLHGVFSDDGLPYGMLNGEWSKVSGPDALMFRRMDDTWYAVFGAPGVYVLQLAASDGRSVATDEVTITVMESTAAPAVAIMDPIDETMITAPTPIIGTVSSPMLSGYELQYRRIEASSNSWRVAFTGTTSMVCAELGILDPTISLNGEYELRLVAWDLSGQYSETEPVMVVFDRNMKIGAFTVSYSDLEIPLAGFPIDITRSYDSRDTERGDFGAGWFLSMQNVRLQKSYRLDKGWVETSTGGLWPVYSLEDTRPHIITITFPDGKVFKFSARPDTATQFAIPIVYPRMNYIPVNPSHGQLEAVGSNQLAVVGGIPGRVDLFDMDKVAGGSLDFEYNPRLFKFTSPEGMCYLIDEREGLKGMTDLNGNSLTFSADAMVHSSGLRVEIERDACGRIAGITDPNGNTISYQCDTNGNLIMVRNQAGAATSYSYDDQHHLISMRDSRGIEPVHNEYDPSGRLVSQEDAFGNRVCYSHQIDQRREVVSNRLGQVTLYEYDDDGNVLRAAYPDGGESVMTYDEYGNMASMADALGQVTTYTYDDMNNRTSITDPHGQTTRMTYNRIRRLASVMDPRGGVVTNSYDTYGHMISSRSPMGDLTTLTYNEHGRLVAVTNALGAARHMKYDSLDRMIEHVDENGGKTVFTLDDLGHILTQTKIINTLSGTVNAVTSYNYNELGWKTNVVYPDGSRKSVEYDDQGRVTASVDPLGHVTRYDYDEMGRLVSTVYADGSTEGWAYDAEGRRVAETDRMGQVTEFEYDGMGRPTLTTHPDNSSISNEYDVAGQLISVTDARGNPTDYEYDAAGRRIAIVNALGQRTTNAYDGNGNVVSITDPL
ncbi:MAG: Ig-like domain-containing protein, partial [Lentisphaerota bacterium]